MQAQFQVFVVSRFLEHLAVQMSTADNQSTHSAEGRESARKRVK
jgi:hypothetical protein